MNILYLSLGEFDSFESGSVHIDLMKKFAENHNVFLVCKNEKRNCEETRIDVIDGINILRIRTGNIKNVSLIEKGLSTLLLEYQFLKSIKKFFNNIKFDLVLYTTPPITFEKTVKYIKKRDKSTTYLMLKDIFPQNAVDIGMLEKRGIKSIIYRYFRYIEKRLYKTSDYIGCMSEANVKYILKHNKEINPSTVEVCPNCIRPTDKSISESDCLKIRNKYNLPTNKKIFVYGGNLGKPQGIDFFIKCLKSQVKNDEVFFLIIGSGTEFDKLFNYINKSGQLNVKLMNRVSRTDYDKIVSCCDVGLIFLDYRFTIPNFPSRILSYMQAKIPIYAVTDQSTDVGYIIEKNNFGWCSTSNDIDDFCKKINLISETLDNERGENAYNYLLKHYTVDNGYSIIMSHFEHTIER